MSCVQTPKRRGVLKRDIPRRSHSLSTRMDSFVRCLLKRIDFREVRNDDVPRIVRRLNNRPGKCLGFRPPNEVFFNLPVAFGLRIQSRKKTPPFIRHLVKKPDRRFAAALAFGDSLTVRPSIRYFMVRGIFARTHQASLRGASGGRLSWAPPKVRSTNGRTRSMGMGKKVVELFSAPISRMVWR